MVKIFHQKKMVDQIFSPLLGKSIKKLVRCPTFNSDSQQNQERKRNVACHGSKIPFASNNSSKTFYIHSAKEKCDQLNNSFLSFLFSREFWQRLPPGVRQVWLLQAICPVHPWRHWQLPGVWLQHQCNCGLHRLRLGQVSVDWVTDNHQPFGLW